MGRRYNTTKALAHSALYKVLHTLRTRTSRWFPDPRYRTSDRQPTPSGPNTWHYDGDKRRGRQTKPRRRITHSGDKRTGSSLAADDTPEWTKNLIVLLSCDPEPMKVEAVFAAPDQVVEPLHLSRSWTCFQKKNIELWCVDNPPWSCQLVWLSIKNLAPRPKQNDVFSSLFLTVLCQKHVMFVMFPVP